jgi:hypothetical protein
MAHRMFHTRIHFDLSTLRSSARELSQWVNDHILHISRVRGITPEEVTEIKNAGFGLGMSSTYVIAGPQNDDQGYDGDGSPTAEYPCATQPWPPKTDFILE